MAAAGKQLSQYFYRRWEEKQRSENIRSESVRVPELCRQKLLNYAESFEELARSFLDSEESFSGQSVSGETDPEDTISGEPGSGQAISGIDRRDLLEKRRQKENRLLISSNLCEVSRIMTQLAEELFRFHPMEEGCRKLLKHALRTESIFADNFCYLTENTDDTRAISVTLHTEKKGGCPADRVADMLSVLLNRSLQLSAASPFLVEQKPHSFVFLEEARFVALTGFCKVTKDNETVSGDHYSILESEKGKLTLLLSDGTGSGEQASRDSEKALDLMEKLLEAGYEISSAANMVNAAFYAGGGEYSNPTLDICDMDLYDGRCRFCKVGGAASFFKRGKKVERISQGSLPLGIFRNVETNIAERSLRDGDYVILMTDGVLEALSESNYEEAMEQAISELEELNPGEVAEKLLELALHGCGGHIRDDMTVLVAGIWENARKELEFV